MTKVYQGAPVYQAVVVVDAPQDVVEDALLDVVVLVGLLRDVVRAEVVAVDALCGVVLVRLKVTRLALQIVLSAETTVAGLDFQLTSMGFTRPPFFIIALAIDFASSLEYGVSFPRLKYCRRRSIG